MNGYICVFVEWRSAKPVALHYVTRPFPGHPDFESQVRALESFRSHELTPFKKGRVPKGSPDRFSFKHLDEFETELAVYRESNIDIYEALTLHQYDSTWDFFVAIAFDINTNRFKPESYRSGNLEISSSSPTAVDVGRR